MDVAHQVVVGARAEGAAEQLGPYALALLLQQRAGRVQVRRVEHPAVTNIIAPLDAALDAADRATETNFEPVRRPVSSRPPASTGVGPPAPTAVGPKAPPQTVSFVRLVARPPDNDRTAPPAPPVEPPPAGLMSQGTLPGLQPARMVASFPKPAAGALSLPPPVVTVAPAAEATPPPAAPPAIEPDAAAELELELPGPMPRSLRLKALITLAVLAVAVVLFLLARPAAQPAAPAHAAVPPAPAPVSAAPAPTPQPAAEAVVTPRVEEDDASDVSPKARSRRASHLVSQGHSFRRAGLLGSARRRYEQALHVFPDYPRALAGLAQVSLAQGKHAEALEYAERLRREKPRDAHYKQLVKEIQRAAAPRTRAR